MDIEGQGSNRKRPFESLGIDRQREIYDLTKSEDSGTEELVRSLNGIDNQTSDDSNHQHMLVPGVGNREATNDSVINAVINQLKPPPALIEIDQIQAGSSHKVQIRDVEVLFPFRPYEAQIAYMTSVIDALNGNKNALLQSPTGTGKTLCLLCATLAWLNKYRQYFINNPNEIQKYEPINIFYSSRTHSQLKQVMKELKRTCYRPITTTLASRDQACIKPDLAGLSNTQKNAACKAARHTKVPEHRCDFFRSYNRNKTFHLQEVKSKLCDIEDLVGLGKRNLFCPYFIERDIMPKADLVLLPYNYLLDGRIRGQVGLEIKGAILIFDEAHNIEKVAEEGCSFTLTEKEFDSCALDIELIKKKIKSEAEGEEEGECRMDEYDVHVLDGLIKGLERRMEIFRQQVETELKNAELARNRRFGNEDEQKGKIDKGRKIFEIFLDTLEDNPEINANDPFEKGLTFASFSFFNDLLGRSIGDLSNVPVSKGGIDNLAFCAFTVYRLLKMDKDFKAGLLKDSSYDNFIDSYILHTHYGDDDSNPSSQTETSRSFSLSLCCMHPGIGFSCISDVKPYNVILTSGTLAPMTSFQSELLIEFPIKLENNHVINTKTQCSTMIVKKGVSSFPLNFSYDRRDDKALYNEMGATLASIAKLVPNGLLVCFASYSLMNKCIEMWRSGDDKYYDKIRAIKPIYKEPRRANDLKRVMEKYLADATTIGAILCCVCRGKVSEGIDFADEMARAVVMIGIPFPSSADLRVNEKKKLLNESKSKKKRIGGGEWYIQQTIRAINQAIGRVIRHKDDYGTVYLCDERYTQNQFTNGFPKWIGDNLQAVDKFGGIVAKTLVFFKDKKRSEPLDQLVSPLNANIELLDQDAHSLSIEKIPFRERRAINDFNLHATTDSQVPLKNQSESRIVNRSPSTQNGLERVVATEVEIDLEEMLEGMKKGSKEAELVLQATAQGRKRMKITFEDEGEEKGKDKAENIKPPQQVMEASPYKKDESAIKKTQGIGCAICYEPAIDKEVLISRCGHLACAKCWEKWLSIKVECPVCKQKVSRKALIKLHI